MTSLQEFAPFLYFPSYYALLTIAEKIKIKAIFFVLSSAFTNFDYVEITHARKNSNKYLVLSSLNRNFVPENLFTFILSKTTNV